MTMVSELMRSNRVANSSYPSDVGGILICMEMTEALSEIFNLSYTMEELEVYRVASEKGITVPVSEGIISKAAKAISDFWERIKEWFEKLRAKIRGWFSSIKKDIESFPDDYEDFVKKNETLIMSADMTDVAKSIQTYEYTNIDDFPALLQQSYQDICNKVITLVEQDLTKLKNGTHVLGNDAAKTKVRLDNSSLVNQAEIFCLTFIKSSPAEFALYGINAIVRPEVRHAYFRNGAKTASDKIQPKSLDAREQISFVRDLKNRERDIKQIGDRIDKGLGDFIKRLDYWKKEFSDIKEVSDIVNDMMTTTSSINKATNLMVTEYVSVIKERAVTAFQICRKAASLASKKKTNS